MNEKFYLEISFVAAFVINICDFVRASSIIALLDDLKWLKKYAFLMYLKKCSEIINLW